MTIHQKHCEVCGTTDQTIYYPGLGGGEYLCPKHSQKRAMISACQEHLQSLFEQATLEWLAHWRLTGIQADELAEAVDTAATRLDDLTFGERRAQVQELLKGMEEKS